MAKISFLIQSSNNSASIYLRLSIDRNNVFKRKTGYVVNPKFWSPKTGYPKPDDEESKRLKVDLAYLANQVEKNLNQAISDGTVINGEWLQTKIDEILEKPKFTDESRLTTYIQEYISRLPYKRQKKTGKIGVSKGTIQKYETLLNKMVEYEKFSKRKYFIRDINSSFIEKLIQFYIQTDRQTKNSTGRNIVYLKTICLDARRRGIQVSKDLDEIKGFREKSDIVYLTFDELETIEKAKFIRPALDNARNWLLIGCYIGQRVSDLLTLTHENIVTRAGLELIELTQKKTGKQVAIALHPRVKAILDNNGGQFPTKISDQKFNEYIKDLCKLAGINQRIKGNKAVDVIKDPEGKKKKFRKQSGVFEKWELCSSHICRRSFATNFYGLMPTVLLISITGHGSEKLFLEYIGKTSNDYAIQTAEYWRKQELEARKEPQMTVLSKAE